ncbi:hypothetical protein QR680_017429 [Steinernema hermaphroditum]|uniref:Uncharacterized protein n=1 Tax=Steinernema hermaphroditum TaxID=289476 RepID=A0AA39HEI3_9BILA|nr:hypothetical protein QR680_017429 [Steinernema hermaphroditum]
MVVEANGNVEEAGGSEVLRTALAEFVEPEESSLSKDGDGFYVSPYRVIDCYFEHVADVGRAVFPWSVIKPAFLWKLKIVMKGMESHESKLASMDDEEIDITESTSEKTRETDLTNTKEFIVQKAGEFDGIPFTFQRLCELISTPSKHYHRAKKFFRALEKNINIVGTVTENGERITGVEEEEEAEGDDLDISDGAGSGGFKQNLFLKVDELDLVPAACGDNPTSPGSSGNTKHIF